MTQRQRSCEASLPAEQPEDAGVAAPMSGRDREALACYVRRRKPVSVKAARTEDGTLRIDGGGGAAAFAARLADAVGTGSLGFALRQLDHLGGIVEARNEKPERALNSLLAAVEGFQPENEMEGMLAVQAAATHEAAMACLKRTAQAETVDVLEANSAVANKLMRTFALQVEALSKLRRGGEQTVRVEHVHVYEGGQAIVGNAYAVGRGSDKNGQQPHGPNDARALALATGASLLCPEPSGARVSVPHCEGQKPVLDARRRQRKRSAQG